MSDEKKSPSLFELSSLWLIARKAKPEDVDSFAKGVVSATVANYVGWFFSLVAVIIYWIMTFPDNLNVFAFFGIAMGVYGVVVIFVMQFVDKKLE